MNFLSILHFVFFLILNKHYFVFLSFFSLPSRRGRQAAEEQRGHTQLAVGNLREEEAVSLHQVSDAGAGKGVSLQHVPHPGPPARDRAATQPHRAPGQDLVPEPEDEDEEAEQGANLSLMSRDYLWQSGWNTTIMKPKLRTRIMNVRKGVKKLCSRNVELFSCLCI